MIFFFLSFFFYYKVNAAEIDSFTPRFLLIDEGLPAINREVNKRIQHAIKEANNVSQCHELVLKTFVALELLRPGYGQIEQFVNNSPDVAKVKIPFLDSVYNKIPEPHSFLFKIGDILFPFGIVIREGKWLIGSDKFGHFFDEGFLFYLQLDTDQSNLKDVLQRSIWTEDTYNGLTFGGIKSYGDLVANYQGMQFWSQFFNLKKTDTNIPYLDCVNKQWVLIRDFNFRDYIDAGFDEGINCSEYKSLEFTAQVKDSINELELHQQKHFQCPLYQKDCEDLITKYGENASFLISPLCLEKGKASQNKLN